MATESYSHPYPQFQAHPQQQHHQQQQQQQQGEEEEYVEQNLDASSGALVNPNPSSLIMGKFYQFYYTL
jgi:hypothetical protein